MNPLTYSRLRLNLLTNYGPKVRAINAAVGPRSETIKVPWTPGSTGEAVPAGALARCISESAFASDIHSLPPINDDLLANAYHGASTLLFPSLVEGFGWPIAEAIACGCPVVTTQVPPMTEVGMEFAYYLPLMPSSKAASVAWAEDAAGLVECAVVSRQKDAQRLQRGSEKAIRTFARNEALDHLERFYEEALMNTVSK